MQRRCAKAGRFSIYFCFPHAAPILLYDNSSLAASAIYNSYSGCVLIVVEDINVNIRDLLGYALHRDRIDRAKSYPAAQPDDARRVLGYFTTWILFSRASPFAATSVSRPSSAVNSAINCSTSERSGYFSGFASISCNDSSIASRVCRHTTFNFFKRASIFLICSRRFCLRLSPFTITVVGLPAGLIPSL